MTAVTYADAIGAMAEWINSRTGTLVGAGNPLQMGAHLKHPEGGNPAAYAFLEEGFSIRSEDSPESPDMLAVMSAQVYAGTRKAASDAATALAEELSTELTGRGTSVTGARIMVADDIQGPQWQPDRELPRYLLGFTVRIRPE
jgi:hypothetical protein